MRGEARAQDFQEEVHYASRDSMRYDLINQTVYLFGAATVKYQDIELTAGRIVLDLKNEEVRAGSAPDSAGILTGLPHFTQAAHKVDADSIRYNFKSKKGLIREVRSSEDQMYAGAHLSKHQPNNEVHSRGGILTTCDHPHPHYHFAVSKMIVIPGDKIITGPGIMKLGNIPTPLVLPFGFFPNHHGSSTGILIPTYGSNDQLGYYLLNLGYYLPISDHFDEQFTGDIYSRGSWGLRSVTRYKTRYRYSGSLDVSHSTKLNSLPEYPDFSKQQNFFVKWSHVVDPKASLTDRFSANVNVGTSKNFTNTFNSSTADYLTNTFASNISWSHLWIGKPYNISASVQHSQNSLNKTFSLTLPSLIFNVQRVSPRELFGGEVIGTRKWYDQIYITEGTTFDNRLNTTEEHLYLGNLPYLRSHMRNGIRNTASISSSIKSRFFTLNPELRLTDRMYFDALRKTYDANTMTTKADTVNGFKNGLDWSIGASLTSKLYGMYTFHGKKLKAIRHVITPNAGLSYTPGNDTRITGPFGTSGATSSYSPFDIGIYGAPPPSASGLVTMGITQSVEAKVLDKTPDANGDPQYKKMKLLDFLGATTSYDLLKDSLRWSPINVSARTLLFNKIDLNLTSVWDPYATTLSGTRYDYSTTKLDGSLAHLVNANAAIGIELHSPKYGQSTTPATTGANTGQVVAEADPSHGASTNFNIPWHLRVNYSYDLARQWFAQQFTDQQRQSVLFTGDFTLFKYWKLGFSSGYDLEAKDYTPTSLNLYWDLHCWEFNLNVIPLGLRKSFSVRINVKASVLHDLKYELRKPIGNSGQLLF